MIHILPLNDLKPHEEKSTCDCIPKVHIEEGEMICVHNSHDQRELKELKTNSNNTNNTFY